MVLKSINCLLADGTTTKIDIGFYIKFKKYNWCCDNDGYVVTSIYENGNRYQLKLHHYVLNFKYDSNIDIIVDHKFGNKKDNRLKKVRKISQFINSLNRTKSKMEFPNIHCYGLNNHYRVRYLDINKVPTTRIFPYIKGENEEDIFLQAFNFFEDIKQSIPHYREAFCLDDQVSSSGESIDEINYVHRINIDRLSITNTSQYKNIYNCVESSRWQVTYYTEDGIRKIECFSYGPRSNITKDEALTKALSFQKQYDQYHPKNKKKTVKNNTNINIHKNKEKHMLEFRNEDNDLNKENNDLFYLLLKGSSENKSLFELLLEENTSGEGMDIEQPILY